MKEAFQRTSDHLITVGLADKSGKIVATLKTTRQHPFFVSGKGFVPTGGLAIGNAIVTRAGPTLTVKSIKWLRRAEGYAVYNFEVEPATDKEDTHNYVVGTKSGGVLVHNGPNCWTNFLKATKGHFPNTTRAAAVYRDIMSQSDRFMMAHDVKTPKRAGLS